MPARVKCPSCRKETGWDGNPFRPFCSERCRLLDLSAWMTEHYRIPDEDVDGTPGAADIENGVTGRPTNDDDG